MQYEWQIGVGIKGRDGVADDRFRIRIPRDLEVFLPIGSSFSSFNFREIKAFWGGAPGGWYGINWIREDRNGGQCRTDPDQTQ